MVNGLIPFPFWFSFSLLNTSATVPKYPGWEGDQRSLSQKTCLVKATTFSFRVKGMKCKSQQAFIFLSLFSGSSHTKIFKDEKEIFCSGCCHHQQSAVRSATEL